MFPAIKSPEPEPVQRSNTSKRRAEPVKPLRKRSNNSEDFGDGDIDDDELVKATCGDLDFEHIDNFVNPIDAITRKNTAKNKPAAKSQSLNKSTYAEAGDDQQEPEQLSNGKWACKHACKDKNACKHLCCKEGMDKPPKKPTSTKRAGADDSHAYAERTTSSQKPKVTQSKLQLTATKRMSHAVEELDLTQEEKKRKADYGKNGPSDYRGLHQLHKTIQKRDPPASLHSVMHTKPAYCYSQGGQHNLSFLQQPEASQQEDLSDYGDLAFDEVSSHFDVVPQLHTQQEFDDVDAGVREQDLAYYPATAPVTSRGSDVFDDQDSLFGDVMVGHACSETLQGQTSADNATMDLPDWDQLSEIDFEADLQDDDLPTTAERGTAHDSEHITGWNQVAAAPVPSHKSRVPFKDSTSSSSGRPNDFRPAKHLLRQPELEKLKQSNANSPEPRREPFEDHVTNENEVLDLFDEFDDYPAKEAPIIPEPYQGLQPWLYEEFGDIVEIVDG
jgi:ATP-dependent DNA helicase HFM1/MER3